MVVVELGEAGGHLATPRAGARDHDDRSVGRDVGVLPVALLRDDGVHIVGIARDVRVPIDGDVLHLHLLGEAVGDGAFTVAAENQGRCGDAPVAQVVDGAHGSEVIGHAEVAADAPALEVPAVDAEDDLDLVLEPLQQAHLDVGIVAGEHSGGVEVEGELAAELQIELAVVLLDTLQNGGGLFGEIPLVVEGLSGHGHTSLGFPPRESFEHGALSPPARGRRRVGCGINDRRRARHGSAPYNTTTVCARRRPHQPVSSLYSAKRISSSPKTISPE